MNNGAILECGENCFCQTGMPVHPPVLMIFDPDARRYVLADGDRCLAVWASAGDDHFAGQICGRPGVHEIGDAMFCDHHYSRARDWISDEMKAQAPRMREADRQRHRERMAMAREEAAQRIALDKERILAREIALAEHSLVYYVRRTDGAIKIGYSGGLAARMSALRREHGPLQLMATHGGADAEEHALHGEFSVLRIRSREEWFRPGLQLLERIHATRWNHGDPPKAGIPVMSQLDVANMVSAAKKAASAHSCPRCEEAIAKQAAREKRRRPLPKREAVYYRAVCVALADAAEAA